MKRILAALAAATAILIPVTGAATAAHADTTCTSTLQGSNACGPYAWNGWPGSNGFNTYVTDQNVGAQPGSTGSITATSPSSWTATANYQSCGGCVQSFTSVQQLTNNWDSSTDWFSGTGSQNMPLNALKLLQVQYTESTPTDPGNQYEFSPDLWTGYEHGTTDIMMWADTSPTRCDGNGLNTSDIIGQATLEGQNWTVYQLGGTGGEIMFILDGTTSTDPVTTDTCAQQKSGTLHILSALRWLSSHKVPGIPAWSKQTMSMFNTGYEVTDGDGIGQYQVSNLTYKVAVK